MSNNRNCTKGYSCGFSCIDVKLICSSQAFKSQAIMLIDNYLRLANELA